MTVPIFYYMQGADGEDATPNGFCIKETAVQTLKFASILNAFPLRGAGHYHFRFRTILSGERDFVWFDLVDPNFDIPVIDGKVFLKVLRIGNDLFFFKVLT